MSNCRVNTALLVGCLVCGPANSAQGVPDSAGDLQSRLAAAQAAERAGDHARAGKEYEAILVRRPELSLIRQSLGITYHLENRFAEAIAEFRKAIRQDDTLWGSYLFLGMDLYKTNQFDAAIAPLERSIELNAKMAEPEARFWLGVTYNVLGKPEQAIKQLRRCAELRPDDLETSYQLARAYERAAGSAFERIGAVEPLAAAVSLLQGERFQAENRPDLARIEMEQALRARPDYSGMEMNRSGEATRKAQDGATICFRDARALFEWASFYEELAATRLAQQMVGRIASLKGKKAEAEHVLRSARVRLRSTAARELKSGMWQKGVKEALAALEAGRPEHAIPELEKSSARGRSPWFRRLLLRAYSEGGSAAEAESLAQQLLAICSDDVDVLLLLGRHYKRLADIQLQEMIRKEPHAYRVHELQGERFEERTDFEAAIREYKAALSKNADAAGVRYALGNVYAKLKQYEAAEEWLKEELQRNPHHALAHARLGGVYLEQGRATDSIVHLEEALRSNGALNAARLDLGRAYTAVARYDDAVTTLKAAAASEPENDRVHYLLANAYTRQGRRQEAQAAMTRYQQLTRERLARTQKEVQAVSKSVK